MAFLTSLMWALYKLKPGVPAIMSPGAGAAGGGSSGMSISAPRATSNLGAVQAASAGGGGGGGAGAGATKVTVVNGSAAGKYNFDIYYLIVKYFVADVSLLCLI
jgi:hypothetical protein